MITTKQVKLLMKHIKKNDQITAAAKAGMDVKTARKYLNTDRLPSESQETHAWKTRTDPFADDWPEIESMLKNAPGLQAKTIMNYLLEKKPPRHKPGQLRTLQRHIRQWRAQEGKNKSVIFCQDIKPGRQSQSDFTWMNELNITINGQPFKHMLFHFMLPYSHWESIYLCFSETFDNLTYGYEKAVWELGFVAPEHRTDNLTAAVNNLGSRKTFQERWKTFMAHYKVNPTANNPGESHENGSTEKSHDTFKTAVEQRLLLRGHRDFSTVQLYLDFLNEIVKSRNDYRKEKVVIEIRELKKLPVKKWHAPQVLDVRVSPSSIINILGNPYSVPSRLISYSLRAYIYPTEIILFYGNKKLQVMPRIQPGERPLINYRHIIDSLVRKPGAFEHYQYKESLFPRLCFRKAYDCLKGKKTATANKQYLKILHLAKLHSEHLVAMALDLLLEGNEIPTVETVKQLIDTYEAERKEVMVAKPNLKFYDDLLSQNDDSQQEVLH